MKTHKVLSIAAMLVFTFNGLIFGQTNTFPPSGKIGIGTPTPGLKLHVNGDVDDFVRLSSDGQPQIWDIGIGKAAARGTFFIARSGISRDFNIDPNGRIGIGTSTPAAKLDVAGGSIFRGDPASSNSIYLVPQDSNVGVELRSGTSGGTPYIDFTNDNSTDFDARIILADNDRLVIDGTHLEVNGGIVSARASDGTNAGIINWQNLSNNKLWHMTMRSGDADKLQLYHYDGSNWSGPHLNINPDGKVGIGTTTPAAKLDVAGNSVFRGDPASSNVVALNPQDYNVGVELRSGTNGGTPYIDFTNDNTSDFDARLVLASDDRLVVDGANFEVNGTTITKVLSITGGSDLAEPFEIADTKSIKPGMVVAIDPEKPGQLRIADKAYDQTVAGIISGANGVIPGLTMKHEGTAADGSFPVSLTGRVYCWADASYGAIRPGDLLTTSNTFGHAMRVTDYAKAQGAIIGKAMSVLQQGKGLVLVLVSLQ